MKKLNNLMAAFETDNDNRLDYRYKLSNMFPQMKKVSVENEKKSLTTDTTEGLCHIH